MNKNNVIYNNINNGKNNNNYPGAKFVVIITNKVFAERLF